MAGLIGAFRIAYPGVTDHLAEPENAAELAARVADGRSEVGLAERPFVVGAAGAESLVSEPRLIQDVLVVRPPGSGPNAAGGRRSQPGH